MAATISTLTTNQTSNEMKWLGTGLPFRPARFTYEWYVQPKNGFPSVDTKEWSFVETMSDVSTHKSKIEAMLQSQTACCIDVAKHPDPKVVVQGGSLVRFYRDQQDCYHWYYQAKTKRVFCASPLLQMDGPECVASSLASFFSRLQMENTISRLAWAKPTTDKLRTEIFLRGNNGPIFVGQARKLSDEQVWSELALLFSADQMTYLKAFQS